MAIIRRRYLFWLIKAYIKRWGKVIVFFFFVGTILSFLLMKFYPVLLRVIPLERKTVIGMTGIYTVDNLPKNVIDKVTAGLTKVKEDGTVIPALASSWEILNNGKTYVFYLRKNIHFSDGTPFTAEKVKYDFANVGVARPDEYTIIFTLKDTYAPFLVTVSRPIFYKGYLGTGDFAINNIELNGDFITSLQLISTENRFKTETYIFYPSIEALKIAFVLGEINQAHGLNDSIIKNIPIETYPNVKKEQHLNTRQLVTLFYNTQDPYLSDKKMRSGLSYALPNTFVQGERVYFPYIPTSKYYNSELTGHVQDLDHSELLIDSAVKAASGSAKPKIILKSLAKYLTTAEEIKHAWEKVGIETKIQQVDMVPDNYMVFLGDFNVSKDPDQYTLWHSGQQNNITKFKNLRIDKLLEDGRKTVSVEERITIYHDFQKYLLDESPASFLYFPYEYDFYRR